MLDFPHRKNTRGDYAPTGREPKEGGEVHPLVADHGADVVDQAPDAIQVAQGQRLAQGEQHVGVRGTVAVEEGEPVGTSLDGDRRERRDALID